MNIQSPLIPSMQRSNRQLGNMYTGYEKRLLQKPKTKHNKTINPKKQKHNKKMIIRFFLPCLPSPFEEICPFSLSRKFCF